MRVHVHTKFCFLCILTFIFHHCNHCHADGHDHPTVGHQHIDRQISEAPYVRATAEPDAPEGGPLEEEQRFYIQQLFRRYGQKDRLDFQGFQSLLMSLGLGEVKLVGVDHEDLGHDHVAHLDLLDVQEGLHSHSSSGDGHNHDHHNHNHDHHSHDHHSHDHHDHHDHSHDHHDHKPRQPQTEQVPTRCSHTTASSLPTGEPSGNQEQTDHDRHDEDHPHQQTEAQTSRKHLTSVHHGHRNHSHDRHNHTDGQLEPPVGPTQNPPRRTRRPGKVRGQRRPNKLPTPETPQSVSHDHAHKNKREAPGAAAVAPDSPVLTEHPGGMTHQHEECLNLTQLLTYYGLHPDSVISPSEFTFLCPALLYQIDSRVCIRHYHQMEVEQEALEPISSVWVWIWGFVSITIISLLSLLGVVLVPILKQSCFKFLLTFLVALAVGTLSGDALLHLLPHSQGHHDHSQPAGGAADHGDLLTAFDGVWKGLTALAGIYLLFIIEHCIGMFKHYRDQRELRKQLNKRNIDGNQSDHQHSRHSDAEWLNLKPLAEDPDSSAVSCDNTHNDTQLSELQPPDSPTTKTPLASDGGRKARKHGHGHGHGHSHGGNCHSDQEMKDAGIASIAWMVIMGDGMHNFSDGLAIGAAFSSNITGGISTSVAVFCHELPHELGDFAVLLKAGMSVKQAIVYNLLSALMAYVGMLIGTAVGQYTHNVTNWIFAITAGMFLYVALVDMLPEMLHGDSEEHKRCHLGHFILQNVGMLTGFAIMLLIAIFEDRIVFDFGF
ncbi:zinc transporter ZIP10 isoform X2 [Poeciliopsis prolifica]|nr:zinc transporter ZIP10 isoform X2 [Poeciliopsis prolifica]XP_054908940.1 zinc transporter ZIP10 isoform X2 [Poeciliopsis prolifica]XP_054908941.1 zinc transporter ZIP10 isoform X2 [Poeciliopsis prolifica]XP_054908942.1 zinc transporter ZIP10 isoform X2 [Poeciliopsis prolifica]